MAEATAKQPDVAPHLPGVERYIAARDAALERVLGPVAKAGPVPDHMTALMAWGLAIEAWEARRDAMPLACYVTEHGAGSSRDVVILAQALKAERMPKAAGKKRESDEIRMLFLNAIRWHRTELGLSFNRAVEACAGEFRGRTYDAKFILRRKGGMFCKTRNKELFEQFQAIKA